MRAAQLRLLLALVLVLLGATVIVGLNLGDDDTMMAMQGQTQTLRAKPEDKIAPSIGLVSSVSHQSRTQSEIALRPGVSVIDLVHVLRC